MNSCCVRRHKCVSWRASKLSFWYGIYWLWRRATCAVSTLTTRLCATVCPGNPRASAPELEWNKNWRSWKHVPASSSRRDTSCTDIWRNVSRLKAPTCTRWSMFVSTHVFFTSFPWNTHSYVEKDCPDVTHIIIERFAHRTSAYKHLKARKQSPDVKVLIVMEDWLRYSCQYLQRQNENHFLLRDIELLADSPEASPEHLPKHPPAPQVKRRKRSVDKSKAVPSSRKKTENTITVAV